MNEVPLPLPSSRTLLRAAILEEPAEVFAGLLRAAPRALRARPAPRRGRRLRPARLRPRGHRDREQRHGGEHHRLGPDLPLPGSSRSRGSTILETSVNPLASTLLHHHTM